MASPARYDLREDDDGWTVFDIYTGQTVVIDHEPMVGLMIQDADDLADSLSWLADHGDRTILQ